MRMLKLETNKNVNDRYKETMRMYAVYSITVGLLFLSLIPSIYSDEVTIDVDPSITQQDLKTMVENWMNNPDKDDTQQRLDIMIAYYTFEETGQQLTHDQEGLTLMNQIRKMISLQIPKAELDELRHQVRVELGLEASSENKILFIDSKLVDCVGVGKQKCMLIREDENSAWKNFYDSIEGFDFTEGKSYKISVKVTDVENPPADASSKKYELIEILENESNSNSRHIPYKDTCAPGFVPLNEICVLNDRCGPGAYAGKVCVMDGIMQPYLRPLQQKHAGISVDNIICAEGKELIFKSHNVSPACVNPSSVEKLKQFGWQTEKPVVACTLEYNPICGMDRITYGNPCMLNSQHMAMKHAGECKISTVTNFEECAAAGNPVMESHPRQCRSSDGQLFVEDIGMQETGGVFADTITYTMVGPNIDEQKGYFVDEIANGVYWLVSSGYQTMFIVTDDGVVVVDAPQPIGDKYIDAINEVTEKPITHMIYSHHHQDHTGAAGQIFPEDITYISHKETADVLAEQNEPNRPVPTQTFEGALDTLNIGNQVIELHHLGNFHSNGDLLILLPEQDVAMLVDLLRPAASPYRAFGVTPNIDLYLQMHDNLQDIDFDVLISGHTEILATKDHIKTNKEFTLDVMENAKQSIDSGSSNPVESCVETTMQQWDATLAGLDTFMADHCQAMIDYYHSQEN